MLKSLLILMNVGYTQNKSKIAASGRGSDNSCEYCMLDNLAGCECPDMTPSGVKSNPYMVQPPMKSAPLMAIVSRIVPSLSRQQARSHCAFAVCPVAKFVLVG